MGRKLTLTLALLGLGLAAAGFEFGDTWPYRLGVVLGCAGTAVSACVAVLQYREGQPFEHHFTEASWVERESGVIGSSEFALEIPRSEHGRGNSPAASIYWPMESGGYEEVHCGHWVEASGAIFFTADMRFSGKVVVR